MNKQPNSSCSTRARPQSPRAASGHLAPARTAHLHVAGTATYTDDIPEPAGTLHAALGMSTPRRMRDSKSAWPRPRAQGAGVCGDRADRR